MMEYNGVRVICVPLPVAWWLGLARGNTSARGDKPKEKNIIKPNMSKARRNKSRGFLSGLYLTEVASFPHSESRLSGFFFKFYKSGLKQAAT
jgi:hypothetical protein